MITLLLRYGANPSLRTSSHKTALDLAASPQVIRLLAQDNLQDEGTTDENSPEGVPYSQTLDSSWKIQKQTPRSRIVRNLRLGKFVYKVLLSSGNFELVYIQQYCGSPKMFRR